VRYVRTDRIIRQDQKVKIGVPLGGTVADRMLVKTSGFWQCGKFLISLQKVFVSNKE